MVRRISHPIVCDRVDKEVDVATPCFVLHLFSSLARRKLANSRCTFLSRSLSRMHIRRQQAAAPHFIQPSTSPSLSATATKSSYVGKTSPSGSSLQQDHTCRPMCHKNAVAMFFVPLQDQLGLSFQSRNETEAHPCHNTPIGVKPTPPPLLSLFFLFRFLRTADGGGGGR